LSNFPRETCYTEYMKTRIKIIIVPEDAWEILFETLEMDCESSVFDPKLRKQIKAALNTVRTFNESDI